jgi:oligopeptide transport system substrate-binding protein
VKLARVIYVPTGDLTAALVRFKAGELDMQLDFPVSQVDALRKELPVETRLTPTLLTYYLALNNTNPKLADARVRRALSLAVDRDVLTEKVLRAGEVPAFSFTPPGVAAYQAPLLDFAVKASDLRQKEAKALLAEAGYGAGNPLTLTYSHSSNLDLRRIAVIIAGMWRRVGVEATPLNTEGKVHFSNMRQGNYEVAFAGWSADFNDASAFLDVLESSRVHSNYSRYRSAAYDALLAKAAAMENSGARAALLRQAEERLLADHPIIPLYHGVTKSLVSQRVVGWRANAADKHLSRYLSVVG